MDGFAAGPATPGQVRQAHTLSADIHTLHPCLVDIRENRRRDLAQRKLQRTFARGRCPEAP